MLHRRTAAALSLLLLTRLAAETLEPGHPIDRDLAAGHADEFSIRMPAGQFVRIVAQQEGIDVVLTILDPSGKTVAVADRPNGSFGPEAASFIAATAGDYRVRVSSSSTAGGHYRIESSAPRKPAAADARRIEAESLLFQAAKDDPAPTRETRLSSIQLYERTLAIWHDLSDSYEEGLSLYGIGGRYEELQDAPHALDYYNRSLPLRRAAGDRPGEADTLFAIGEQLENREENQKALDLYHQALAIRRAIHAVADEAATLNTIARLQSYLGEHNKALDAYTQALALRRAAGDRQGEANALYFVGREWFNLKDGDKAIDNFTQALPIFHELGDRSGEASALKGAGRVYYGLGENQQALDSYQRALTLLRDLPDRLEEADTLAGIGNVYYALKDKKKALEFYHQALPLYRAGKDRAGEANALDNMALCYKDLGERQNAIDAYTALAPLSHGLGNSVVEVDTLIGMAELHAQLNHTREALNAYSAALPLLHAAKDAAREADILLRAGRLHRQLNEYVPALEVENQSLALRRTLGDAKGQADVLLAIGSLEEHLGDRRPALTHLSEGLALARASGYRVREADLLYMIGLVNNQLGEKKTALEFYGQALAASHALKDDNSEAIVLASTGALYHDLGDKAKALDYDNRALPIFHASGDKSAEAATLSNIAILYDEMGEHQKALEFDNQSLPLRREVGDRAGEAATLNNIGLVYSRLGDARKALDFYSQAHVVAHADGAKFEEAAALANMGRAYDGLGDKRKALECFTQSLPLRRAVGDRSGEASTLSNIGTYYLDLKDYRKALEFLTGALALNRATGDRPGESITLNNLASAYHELGETGKSFEYDAQSLLLSRAVGDRHGEAVTLNNLSQDLKNSRPDLAIFFGKQAINVLQTIRRDNRSLDESLRRTFDKSLEGFYRVLASILIGRQRFGEAEEVLNLLKDKEASDFIERDAVADQLRPASLLDSERQALGRYEQIVSKVVAEGQAKSALITKASKEALSAEESKRSEQLDSDLAAANTVLLRFFDDEEKSFAANSAASKRVTELRESEGLQDTLQTLGPDVVAIYTLVLPDRYTALLISSGARKAYSTAIPEADLNRKIFAFRQQLQNPQSDPLPLARELYRIVFPEGLREDLDAINAKTIMWSIDSTLRYIPIAALHDGQDYLVSRFRNSLITPASLTRLTEGSQTLWKGVGFGVSQASGDFSALPSVPDELRRIFQQGQADGAQVPGRVNLDPDFTRAAFLAAMRQPDKSVVHIATHFASRPGVAANSQLLLGDGSKLSLAEIEATPRLFSGVDLLTLSACSTAFTNSTEDGREVDSFGTIAQRLGARAVIASLWSVNDDATARLMETMYRIRQAQPTLGKSEALRQAQEQMAKGVLGPGSGQAADRGVKTPLAKPLAAGWTHPYYWAPFILIGNWK